MSMNIKLDDYLTREGRIAKVTNINKDGSCTGEIDGVDGYILSSITRGQDAI